MNNILCNPLFYILIVNIFALVWALKSFRKTINEKWMTNLREAGAEVVGAAELIYSVDRANSREQLAAAKADFIGKEQKLLLLFAHNVNEKESFSANCEALKAAAETQNVDRYRGALNSFSELVSGRILKEWNSIESWF